MHSLTPEDLAELAAELKRQLSEDATSETQTFHRKLRNYIGGGVLLAIAGGNGSNVAEWVGLVNGRGNEHEITQGLEETSKALDSITASLGTIKETQADAKYQIADLVRRLESLERTREYQRLGRTGGSPPGASMSAPLIEERATALGPSVARPDS